MAKRNTVMLVGIVFILALFLTETKQLSFIPLSVQPIQYIGNPSFDNIDNVGASNTATIGNYKIVTTQQDYYVNKDTSPFSLVYVCSTRYDVYHKNVLIQHIEGEQSNSGWVDSRIDINYYKGVEVISNKDADLIVSLRTSQSYSSSPRFCKYSTNEFVLNIPEEDFDVNVTKENNNIKVNVLNNYNELVTARVKVTYSYQTPLGEITKEDIRLIDLNIGENSYYINIEEEITKENIFADVKTDILFNGELFQGINIPSYQCYVGKEIKEQSGKLVSVGVCDYVKIGDSRDSFQVGEREVIERTIIIKEELSITDYIKGIINWVFSLLNSN